CGRFAGRVAPDWRGSHDGWRAVRDRSGYPQERTDPRAADPPQGGLPVDAQELSPRFRAGPEGGGTLAGLREPGEDPQPQPGPVGNQPAQGARLARGAASLGLQAGEG